MIIFVLLLLIILPDGFVCYYVAAAGNRESSAECFGRGKPSTDRLGNGEIKGNGFVRANEGMIWREDRVH
jgi:hypothetical protein